MAIVRMISRDPGEFREFQARMVPLGKIRIGVYATPEGKRGRPEKIDTFRFTADNEALIRAVADEYGGTVEPWTPQGSKTPQWQVITDANAVEVYVINGQKIDPVYEAWAGGRTCVRRCDGEWEQIKQEACLCNGPDRPQDARELCKPTVRVQVMLKRIRGLGSWLLESHGENACMELAMFGPFVAAAPISVPAMLRLRAETRRQWNAEKGRFDTLNFYVPWFDISDVTSQQVAIGGDVLTQALMSAGAPSAMGGPTQAAIEARPVSAPVPAPAAPFDIDAKRAVILADIEAQTTLEGLNAIRDKLKSKGVDDKQVVDAWLSKEAGIQAAEDIARPYRVLVTGSRTWTDTETLYAALDVELAAHPGMALVHGDCKTGADHQADVWAHERGVEVERHPADWNGPDGKAAGFKRNQAMVDTGPDRVFAFIWEQSKGATHCAAAADAAGLDVVRYVAGPEAIEGPIERKKPCLNPYCVGTATPCGFTPQQHMETHGVSAIIEADRAAGLIPGEPVEGTVEGDASALPMVPDGDYDADELYTMIMTGASQQTPPLTTSEVNGLITRMTGMQPNRVTGHALAQLRAGLKAGTVTWR